MCQVNTIQLNENQGYVKSDSPSEEIVNKKVDKRNKSNKSNHTIRQKLSVVFIYPVQIQVKSVCVLPSCILLCLLCYFSLCHPRKL